GSPPARKFSTRTWLTRSSATTPAVVHSRCAAAESAGAGTSSRSASARSTRVGSWPWLSAAGSPAAAAARSASTTPAGSGPAGLPGGRSALGVRGADQGDGAVHGLTALQPAPDPLHQPGDLRRPEQPPQPIRVGIGLLRNPRDTHARNGSQRPDRDVSYAPAVPGLPESCPC